MEELPRTAFRKAASDEFSKPNPASTTCLTRAGRNLPSGLRLDRPFDDCPAPVTRQGTGTPDRATGPHEAASRMLHRLASRDLPSEAPGPGRTESIRLRPSCPAYPNPKGGRFRSARSLLGARSTPPVGCRSWRIQLHRTRPSRTHGTQPRGHRFDPHQPHGEQHSCP